MLSSVAAATLKIRDEVSVKSRSRVFLASGGDVGNLVEFELIHSVQEQLRLPTMAPTSVGDFPWRRM